MITIEQKKKWLREKCCHVCGSNKPHSHPEWMWLANPVPEMDDPEVKERIYAEKKLNKESLKAIVGK